MKKEIADFLKEYLTGIKFYIIIAILLSLLLEVVGLGISYLISLSLDYAISDFENRNFIPILLGFLGIIIFNGILMVLNVYISENAGWKVKNKLRMQLLEKCSKLKSEAAKQMNNGEILELIERDTNIIYSFFAEQFVSIATSIVIIVLILVILFQQSVSIGMYELVFAVFAGCILYHFKEKDHNIRVVCREEQAKISGFEGEMFDAADDIRGNDLSETLMEKYRGKLNGFLPIYVRSEKTKWNTFIVMLFLRTIGIGVCLLVSIYMLKDGMISIGTVYLFYQYTQYILYPLNVLQQYIKEKQGIDVSVERILNLLKYEEEEDGGQEKKNDSYSIEFKNVSFSYNMDTRVLKNVDLYIPEGKIVGLGGRTGGGKTTLISLLVKLYRPDSGKVMIGGEDIEKIDTKFLRKNVLYIPQQITLFHNTLRDNIILFQKTIPDEIIIHALKVLGLEEWYRNRFPQGLDTMLLQDGEEISAGERQLLSIIRAYIINSPILIFDEITAKIDPITENQIFDSLKKVMKEKTCIIISHNPELRKMYDVYYQLEEGEIVGA